MRLSIVFLGFLSTAALAHKVALYQDGWFVEFTTTDGQFIRIAGYKTREACEAAIPAAMKAKNGHNGHCVYFDSKTGTMEGSQDPAAHH
jgi:hypothetical protein